MRVLLNRGRTRHNVHVNPLHSFPALDSLRSFLSNVVARSFRATRLERNDKQTAKVKFAPLDAPKFNTHSWPAHRGLGRNSKSALIARGGEPRTQYIPSRCPQLDPR